jgi:predicted carbohydrate-binding protein with CBM5 and CBM33 domain
MLVVMAFVVIVVTSITAIVGPLGSAKAHGAMTMPASRTYECYEEGPENPQSAACKAAVALGGTQPLYDWFAVLRSDGSGRTRGFIPDGQLCSGGNTKYAAYDAPRNDWPATTLQANTQYDFTYAAWAPHPGTFTFFVTNSTYDPTKPLTWDNLQAQPFLTAVQPAVTDGAYHMTGRTPAGLTGRQIIYSVWTRSDSTETFYGCSDVVFGSSTGTPTPPGSPTPTPPPPPPASCTATVTIGSNWVSGYQAAITVKNTSIQGLDPWMVMWTMPAGVTITSGWNATVTQDGTMGMGDAPSWNRTLAAGASVTVNYNANGSASPPPSAVSLNGVACH